MTVFDGKNANLHHLEKNNNMKIKQICWPDIAQYKFWTFSKCFTFIFTVST